MWAEAAQPRTGLTPMIPTPSFDPGDLAVRSTWVVIGAAITCICKYLIPQVIADASKTETRRHGSFRPAHANELRGRRGLEAWRSLLRAQATLMCHRLE